MHGTVSKKKNNLLVLGLCGIICFICLTICSLGSFLYEYGDSLDENCFFTVAKCMLRGDVLYRDIYEHKGLYLYFFYMVANLISTHSYIGIYVIELVIGTAYLFTAYKIADLYLDTFLQKICVTALTGFFTYTPYVYFGGGQCDEFALLPIALTIYISAKYFKYQYPERIPFVKVAFIGSLTAVLFWIKYTMVGAFAGLVIYIVYKQIRNKTYRNIAIYTGEFLVGFLVGSIPLILYFGLNHAFRDLFQVYFYNLLFLYNPMPHGVGMTIRGVLSSPSKFASIFCISVTMFSALLFLLSYKGKRFKSEEKYAFLWMFLAESLMVGSGVNLQYSQECLYAFSCMGIICFFVAFTDCRQQIKKAMLFIMKPFARLFISVKENTSVKNSFLFLLFSYIYFELVSNSTKQNDLIFLSDVKDADTSTLIKLLLVFSSYFIVILLKKAENVFNKKNKTSLFLKLKYLTFVTIFIVSFFLKTKYVYRSAIILIFIELVYDYSTGKIIPEQIRLSLVTFFNKIKEKSFRRILSSAVCLMVFSGTVYYACPFTDCMSRKIEDYPFYQMAQIIENSGIENPAVIHSYLIDAGIYMMCDIYPPCKYFGGYCIDLPEIEQTNHKYIDEGKADFIVSYGRPIQPNKNFRLVYKKEFKFFQSQTKKSTLYLYQHV